MIRAHRLSMLLLQVTRHICVRRSTAPFGNSVLGTYMGFRIVGFTGLSLAQLCVQLHCGVYGCSLQFSSGPLHISE